MKRSKLKQFKDLTDEDKQRILDYVTRLGVAITKAAKELNVSAGTINKVFEERFEVPKDKKEKLINQTKTKENGRKNIY